MMSEKKLILVTGGLGYIGSHTVVELLDQNYEVVIIDNLSNSEENVLNRIEKITGKKPIFYKKDIKNIQEIEPIFKKHKIESIIHFAALKSVPESVENPLLYYKNNVNGTIYLLELVLKYNVKNFIFSSSCTVYGQPDKIPVTENTMLKPANSPYGETKQICENILKNTTKISKLKVISLRYFNPIGAHPSALIGELPKGIPSNLLPFITQTSIGKRDQLKVFGNDYNTKDGTCIRDYIYVVDLAKAHILANKKLIESDKTSTFDVYNLGVGNGYSVLEIIKNFEEVTGQKVNYKIVERRLGDVESIYADAQKAKNELKWEAKISLKEILKTAWEWEKSLV